MASQGIWFGSFLVYGLLLQVSKGQKAKYDIFNWNQSQHKHRTTSEPRLGVFDRVNTTDIPEEFEPVANSRGIVINKAVPGQEMFNDVFSPEYIVTDSEKVSKKHIPVNQPLQTTEPQLGIFDRINTTDVPEEFEPVTNREGVIINKPVHGQEMYNYFITQENTSISHDKSSDTSLPHKQTLTKKTTETHLGVFDRVNTTNISKEFQLLTKSIGAVISQRVPGHEIHNDALKSGRGGNGNMSRLIEQGVRKVQEAKNMARPENMIARVVNTLTRKGKDSTGHVQLYSVIRKSQGHDLTKARHNRKRGEHENTEKQKRQSRLQMVSWLLEPYDKGY